MAVYCSGSGYCILFPGGKGTADMRRRAVSHHITVIEYEEDQHVG